MQQHQFINLSILSFLGAFFSNFYLVWYEVFGILLFTFTFEVFLGYIRGVHPRVVNFSFSSFSTSIGVMLMMVSSQFYIYFVVIALALLQKHYLRLNNQHFFNPSNFAIIMALLLFYDDAHIVLGQLGDELWIGMLLAVLALAILLRANRWIIPLFFIIFYLLFQYIFIVSLDPVLIMQEIFHRFYSVSFILFILFMLTDPRTTPSSNLLQVLFAFFIAVFSVLLDYIYGFRVQHLFMSIFLFSFFVGALPLKKLSLTQIKVVVIILLCIIAVLTYIEIQQPYYFEMNG